jgi:hypothetical protein
MNNISIFKEDILLNKDSTYYIIDVLYIDDIRLAIESDLVNLDKLDGYLRQNVFDSTRFPFAKYKAKFDIFEIDKIKKENYDLVKDDEDSVFVTDTGLIVFIEESNFLRLISIVDYCTLVDSMLDPINIKYWEEIAGNFEYKDIALVLAPGMNSGKEFVGSGTYRIV